MQFMRLATEPLVYAAIKTWCARTDSNSGSSLIRRVSLPLDERRMEPMLGIEPRSVAYQATALPLSYNDWSRSPDLSRAIAGTSRAHRHLCLIDWSRVSESN